LVGVRRVDGVDRSTLVATMSDGYAEVDAFYVGCWQQVGHYTWLPGMKKVPYRIQRLGPWGYNELDKRAFDTRGWRREQLEGWTAIGREDRTVDGRPGSHSVFAFKGDLTTSEAVQRAIDVFPEVMERMFGRPSHSDQGRP
jgi:hypothetical protein